MAKRNRLRNAAAGAAAGITVTALACFGAAKKFDATKYKPKCEESPTPGVCYYGAEDPKKSGIEKKKLDDGRVALTLWNYWDHDHVLKKDDWEPVTVIYESPEDLKNGNPDEVRVRMHWRVASCDVSDKESVQVVSTNPAHTPLVTDCKTNKTDFIGELTRMIGKVWRGIADIFNKAKPMNLPESQKLPSEDHNARSKPAF